MQLFNYASKLDVFTVVKVTANFPQRYPINWEKVRLWYSMYNAKYVNYVSYPVKTCHIAYDFIMIAFPII